MSQEILDTVEMLANEKDLSREIVFQAMESSMSAAIESEIDPICVEADIDRSTGAYCFFKFTPLLKMMLMISCLWAAVCNAITG